MAQKLAPKQRAFIEHYLRCLNATQAARCAGYKGDDHTLSIIGRDNLQKLDSEINVRLVMNDNEVLTRLSEHARGDMGDFVDVIAPNMAVLNLQKAENRGKLHLIRKLRHTAHGIEIELYNAQTALAQLARHHGLLSEQHVISWQHELESAGLDASDVFEQLVTAIEPHFTPSD